MYYTLRTAEGFSRFSVEIRNDNFNVILLISWDSRLDTVKRKYPASTFSFQGGFSLRDLDARIYGIWYRRFVSLSSVSNVLIERSIRI